jgi:hypothetical protein
MDRDSQPGEFNALLVPFPSGDDVLAGDQAGLGNVKNSDRSLIEPVSAGLNTRTSADATNKDDSRRRTNSDVATTAGASSPSGGWEHNSPTGSDGSPSRTRPKSE